MTSRRAAAPGTAVLVCVPYTPPSVCHVPWLFDVGDEPGIGALLRRLSACVRPAECHVLNADAFRAGTLRRIASAHGVPVFETGSQALSRVLVAFAAARPELDTLLAFPAASVVPDCAESVAMLARHADLAADVTLPEDVFLDGLLPAVLRSTAVSRLVDAFPEASDLRALAARLRLQCPAGVRLVRHRPAADSACALQRLPAGAQLADRWTRDAAAHAISRAPHACDSTPAHLFKEHLLASLDVVPEAPLPDDRDGTAAGWVLFSSLRVAFSGGEQSLLMLMTNLDRQRYRPIALLPFESVLARKLRTAGIPAIVAGWDYAPITARNLEFCDRLLRRLRPRIVHVDALPNPALMVAARARGIPVVGHLRIQPADEISSYTYLTDHIIAISETVAARLRRFNVRPESITVVHNAVDVAGADSPVPGPARETFGIPAGAFVFVVVARLTRAKRLDLYFGALDQVMRSAPGVHTIVLGEASAPFGPYSPDDVLYAESLRTSVGQRTWGAQVHWLGFQPDLRPFYRLADCLVSCNPGEPFGRCTVEAMAAGLAVIGPDEGGSPEIIDADVNGLLFTSESADSLARAMLSVCLSEQRRRRLGEHARRRAADFGAARHVRGVQGVYDRAVAERSATG